MKALSRRHLIAGLGALASGAARAAPQKRTNILFVLADDWGFTSSMAVDELGAKTPNFDRVMRQGLTFTNAFAAAPSCTASRGSILTGRPVWQLEEGANLGSVLPKKFGVYPELMDNAGYLTGFFDKGWAPGQLKPVGRTKNPAGDRYESFKAFMDKRPAGQPFCFWLGSHHPHRPYEKGQGRKNGVSFTGRLPPYLADDPVVRADVEDYIWAVQSFDAVLGEALKVLEEKGELADTLVVVTGDNGPSFTHSKATLYDPGTHVPMAMMWPGRIKPGGSTDAVVVLTDLAATFLEVAGIPKPAEMTSVSLLPLIVRGGPEPHDAVFTAMERHMDGHTVAGDGYPMRAIRTKQHLYIRNFHPERWPAGDPPRKPPTQAGLENDNYAGFADIGPGPGKARLVLGKDEPRLRPYFEIATRKRPAQELYDVEADPYQLKNLAGDKAHAALLARLDARLTAELKRTGDPRLGPNPDVFDRYPSYSDPGYGRPDDF